MSTTSAYEKEQRPPVEECQGLVERIAAGEELRRAARLRSFLVYVCERYLAEGVTVIHEQEIGTAVFGRQAGYDTSIDNIVRVNATELRKRLEHYFAGDGRNEELILEIQRGSYAPAFSRRTLATGLNAAHPEAASDDHSPLKLRVQEPKESVHPAGEPSISEVEGMQALQTSAPAKTERPGWLLVWPVFCAVLLAICGWLIWQVHSLRATEEPWTRTPATRAFWGQFFSDDAVADILLADTSFALAQDMLHRQFSLSNYLDYSYKQAAEDPNLAEVQRNDLARVLERNNGSIADFQVAAQIMALDTNRRHLTLAFARSYSPEAAKHHSVVLIGSRQSNPWVSLFADNMNFDLEYDPVLRQAYVINRSPLAGEAKRYPTGQGAEAIGLGYAVIGFMPDISGKGKALFIEGTDSQATGAAGEFITSEDSLAELEKKLPGNTMPYFEVLLRTTQLNGTPMHGQVVAYRVYPNGRFG